MGARPAVFISVVHGVDDDPARFVNLKELVEGIVTFGATAADAGCAQIIVWAVQTLVADSDNNR
jgi:hypothetical protein